MCWKVWEVRNLEVHGDARGFPPNVVAWATAFLDSYAQAQHMSLSSNSPPLPCTWELPDRDTMKVNVVVTLPPHSESFFVGMVARDFSRAYGGAERRLLVDQLRRMVKQSRFYMESRRRGNELGGGS